MGRSTGPNRTWQQRAQLGVDLAVITTLAVVIGAIQTSLLPVSEPIRILGGLVLLFLLPGYGLIAALFPRSQPIIARSTESPSAFFGRPADEQCDEPRPIVRFTLSLVSSVIISGLVGTALGTTVGFTTTRFAIGLTGVTVVCSVVALVRRAGLSSPDRYAPAVGSHLVGVIRPIGRGSRFGRLVRVIVVVSLLVSVGSVAYAVSVPQQGETPTDLYLMTENETGELTTYGYPNTLRQNEEQTLHFGVTNREGTEQQFTVVVTLDRVATTGNSSMVIERVEIDRFSNTLLPDQWWRQKYEIEPVLTGSNLRLTHYLYRGDAPAEPDEDEAYRVAYLRISGGETTPSGETESTNESVPLRNESTQPVNESVAS